MKPKVDHTDFSSQGTRKRQRSPKQKRERRQEWKLKNAERVSLYTKSIIIRK
jgi:hypothetical protein